MRSPAFSGRSLNRSRRVAPHAAELDREIDHLLPGKRGLERQIPSYSTDEAQAEFVIQRLKELGIECRFEFGIPEPGLVGSLKRLFFGPGWLHGWVRCNLEFSKVDSLAHQAKTEEERNLLVRGGILLRWSAIAPARALALSLAAVQALREQAGEPPERPTF